MIGEAVEGDLRVDVPEASVLSIRHEEEVCASRLPDHDRLRILNLGKRQVRMGSIEKRD